MPIITITSDWSRSDYYLPSLKGKMFSVYLACKELNKIPVADLFNIVDISTTVKPFDISEACFILKNSYHHYPDGSIHLIAVESEPHDGIDMVVVKRKGHYFISPDDGRFALLFSVGEEVEAFRLSGGEEMERRSSGFSALELFEKGVRYILQGRLDELEKVELRGAVSECAVVMPERIVGRVVYIDSYGNAITNITRESFFKVATSAMVNGAKKISYVIFVQGPYLKLEKISDGYWDVEPGEELAFFNSLDQLELAINGGNFTALEGIDTTAEIMIKFTFEK
ncbi:MAG: SAM-dependent chlorinase/fluorinase [Bacteroidales bacterium]|nr:SAM-dependent chlorinase/fluorinase [Bacteroidales bacterium]